ncbi:hypothetical protein FRC02_006972 [Tulasnella sp. 418]|nr:hypothetical protein FRC02_006972 [Tulasnella sp. 418]
MFNWPLRIFCRSGRNVTRCHVTSRTFSPHTKTTISDCETSTMSRRATGNNNVRGPSSALTSFLRDQGIDTRAVNTWTRRIEEGNSGENGQAGPSTSNGNSRGNPSRRQSSGVDTGYNSEDLDRDDAQDEKTSASAKGKKKKTKAQSEKEKAKAKAAFDAKKRKRGDSDYEDDDDEDNAYTAPSKALGHVKAPDIGSFENCAKCDKRFTVTKYTIPCNPPPGYLCHDCAKEIGEDPFKKRATPRKKRAPVDRRKVVNFEEKEAVKGLATMCIEIISKHIDDVEALGDIGAVNMINISKIISKNRKLTPENVLLFYGPENTTLTLHDVTCLQTPALTTLASLNPNLQALRLDFCGRMVDSVLEYYGKHLQHLTRIELLGPFLVRKEGWLQFLNEVGDRLQGFLIFQSPRFDLSCLETLVNRSSESLTELRLAEVGRLADEWLTHISSLRSLTFLDLSYPSQSLSDDAVIPMIANIGQRLEHLDLSGNIALTDNVLTNGIAVHAPAIRTLIMSDLELLTDEGVSQFFGAYQSTLSHINFSRNHDLSSDALLALLSNAEALTHLNINSWKSTSNEALMEIANVPRLEWVDFGWCREVDDFVIKALMDNCENLSVVKCFGCSAVTENCPKRRGVSIFGVESHVAT